MNNSITPVLYHEICLQRRLSLEEIFIKILLPFMDTNYEDGKATRHNFMLPKLATSYLTTKGKSFSK